MNKYLNMFRAGGKGKTFMRSADKLSKGVEKAAEAFYKSKSAEDATKNILKTEPKETEIRDVVPTSNANPFDHDLLESLLRPYKNPEDVKIKK